MIYTFAKICRNTYFDENQPVYLEKIMASLKEKNVYFSSLELFLK